MMKKLLFSSLLSCPELNPSEQAWQDIKNRYKNQNFKSMEDLKKWLHVFVKI